LNIEHQSKHIEQLEHGIEANQSKHNTNSSSRALLHPLNNLDHVSVRPSASNERRSLNPSSSASNVVSPYTSTASSASLRQHVHHSRGVVYEQYPSNQDHPKPYTSKFS
jgi:hypothetical protein